MRQSRLLAAWVVIEVDAISSDIEVLKIGSKKTGFLDQHFGCDTGRAIVLQVSAQRDIKPFPPLIKNAEPRSLAIRAHSPLKYSAL